MAANDQRTSRIALVTGANRGIGWEVCRQLAQQPGMIVLLGARDKNKGEAVARELTGAGGEVRAQQIDVTDAASVTRLAAEIEAEWGRLDVLVNNAAGFVDWTETASGADLDATRVLLETNLLGPWRLFQAFLPLLRNSAHGRIVNVSSGAGSHGETAFGLGTNHGAAASYGISKAALNALTAKQAAELEGSNILVDAVCPGLTATAPGMEAMGARLVADGAASVVWAATLEDNGPTGGFFRDGKPLPW